jgi:hypothetical protein
VFAFSSSAWLGFAATGNENARPVVCLFELEPTNARRAQHAVFGGNEPQITIHGTRNTEHKQTLLLSSSISLAFAPFLW